MQRWATARKTELWCREMQDMEGGLRIGWQDPSSGGPCGSVPSLPSGQDAWEGDSPGHRAQGAIYLPRMARELPGGCAMGGWSGLLPVATGKCHRACALQDPQTFPTPPGSAGSTLAGLSNGAATGSEGLEYPTS